MCLLYTEEHSRKENILKSEAFIPEKRQLLIGAQSIDTNLTLADLQDVKQLDTLVIVQTIMATIAGHTSTHHHYLMAYAYVMCIWRVSDNYILQSCIKIIYQIWNMIFFHPWSSATVVLSDL